MVLMDSLDLIYIRKVSSFCPYGPYELRYFDVKLQFAELHVLKIQHRHRHRPTLRDKRGV